ncbi:hypothetical protein AAC387_Pa11g2292 [Persea americana]
MESSRRRRLLLLLHLLVILLGFNHLISLNEAVLLTTGSRRMLQEPQYHILASGDAQEKDPPEELWKEELINGRMDIENTDYPGSGANHRHTPKPAGRS